MRQEHQGTECLKNATPFLQSSYGSRCLQMTPRILGKSVLYIGFSYTYFKDNETPLQRTLDRTQIYICRHRFYIQIHICRYKFLQKTFKGFQKTKIRKQQNIKACSLAHPNLLPHKAFSAFPNPVFSASSISTVFAINMNAFCPYFFITFIF